MQKDVNLSASATARI